MLLKEISGTNCICRKCSTSMLFKSCQKYFGWKFYIPVLAFTYKDLCIILVWIEQNYQVLDCGIPTLFIVLFYNYTNQLVSFNVVLNLKYFTFLCTSNFELSSCITPILIKSLLSHIF